MDFAPEAQVLSPEEADAAFKERMQKLYSSFATKRDKWVLARANSGVEKRWRNADKLFHTPDDFESLDSFEDTLRNGPSKKSKQPKRSRITVNIIRPKVTIAIARLCEIQLPVDDKNYGLELTPDPELDDAIKDPRSLLNPQTGQPVAPVAEVALAERSQAEKALEGAVRKLDDVLAECHYNSEQRKVIEAGVRVGTGVLKGPFPMRRVTRRYKSQGGVFAAVQTEDIRPASKEVPCSNLYPDPSCGKDIQRGSGIYERKPATRKELRALIGIPGYDEDAIREVLRESPKRVAVAQQRIIRQNVEDESYDLWEYHGEVEPRDIEDLCQCVTDPQGAGLLSEEGDPLVTDNAVLVMVQDRVIGILPPWSDDLPYDFWCWREDDDSPFGFGLCDELSNQQRVVNAAWRQVMDGAGMAAGGMLVVKKGAISPQGDGALQIAPREIFIANEEVDDVRTAIMPIQMPSALGELITIMKSAMELADQESGIPLLMQGDQGSAPDTLGGTTLLYQQANSPLRHRVKLYDDRITVPHLTRYYRYLMDHDEDQTIKGDYQVVARGASVLIDKDTQQQGLTALVQLMENPIFGPLLSDQAVTALRSIIRGYRLNPDDFVPTDEEIAQKKAEAAKNPPPPPPPDPQIVRAQTQVEVKKMDLEDRDKERAFQAHKQEQELAHKERALEYNAQREQAEYQIAMTDSDLQRVLALLSLHNDASNAEQDRALKERLETIKIDNQRQIFNAETMRGTNIAGGV